MEEKQEPLNQLQKDMGADIKPFEDIKIYPNLKVENLFIKYMTSTTNDEPAILSNSVVLWKDTLTTKYYLKANFNGTSKKIELT